MYGTLIQLAGMGYNSEMQGRAAHSALTKNRKVRAAEQQYGGYAAQDEASDADYYRNMSMDRLRNQGALASRISGQPALAAGAAGESDYANRLAAVMGQGDQAIAAGTSGIGRGGPGMQRWGDAAYARSAPRLASQANLVRLAGRRQGIDRFRQDEMNANAEAGVNMDRRVAERGQRSALNDAYRQRKLSEIMRANGVDTGEAGMIAQGQLVQGLAGIAGSGLNSYMANRPAASSSGYSPAYQSNLNAASPGGSAYNEDFSQYQGAH
jgi:hypothetical protein